MPKRGKGHKWWGCWKSLKCKNFLCKNRNKNNLLIKKNY